MKINERTILSEEEVACPAERPEAEKAGPVEHALASFP